MPALAHLVRPWLNGLLAGLLAVAAVLAPAQHERMMLGRAVAALTEAGPGPAAAHRMHAGHGDRHGDDQRHRTPAGSGHEHRGDPSCFACLLMGAPGLPAVAFAGLAARALPAPALAVAPRSVVVAALARASHRPRGPPAFLRV